MSTTRMRGAVVFLALATAGSIFAQTDIRGHWSGEIQGPGGSLGFEVDLDNTSGGWIGSVSIPAQGANGMPLDMITFKDGKGSFRLKGAPGDPTFNGTLSADGKVFDGTFSQGPNNIPLKLARNGDAKVVVPKPSPAVAEKFLGSWEGTIALGPGLRTILTVTNGKAGAEATMVSVDQGNASIPVSAITTTGNKILLLVTQVSASFQGDLNEAGTEIAGTFTQLGNSVPLTLKKSAAKP